MTSPSQVPTSRIHHFVPQYYLKSWIRKDGLLYRINKRYGNVRRLAPAGVMYITDFHTNDIPGSVLNISGDEVEHHLENRYENSHAPVLQYIIRQLTNRLSIFSRKEWNDTKTKIAEILAVQLYRTPRVRENMRASAEREANNPYTSYTKEQFMKQGHLLILRDGDTIQRTTDYLSDFKMIFIISNGVTGFLTSDAPVITGVVHPETGKLRLWPSQGIGAERAELYFPLSPRHMLVAAATESRVMDGSRFYCSDSQVQRINDMIYHDAQEFVVSNKYPEQKYLKRYDHRG